MQYVLATLYIEIMSVFIDEARPVRVPNRADARKKRKGEIGEKITKMQASTKANQTAKWLECGQSTTGVYGDCATYGPDYQCVDNICVQVRDLEPPAPPIGERAQRAANQAKRRAQNRRSAGF